MERSESQSRIIEYLRIKPISHSQIQTFQIAIPESEREEISQERRDAIRRSLIEQGSNLIPLIVRRTEAYSNEEEYEVVFGVDWCVVAKELSIKCLWAWVFELSDEEVVIAKTQMEQLATIPGDETIQIKTWWQQLDRSFQEKLEILTKKIEQSVKKNEDLLKKQIKALTEKNSANDEIEQIKNLLLDLELNFHNKVDKLAKKFEEPGNKTVALSRVSEVNQEGAMPGVSYAYGFLGELENLISQKLDLTVKGINQYVAESINGIENDLKNQIAVMRYEFQNSAKSVSKKEVKLELDGDSEGDKKPKAKAKSKSKSPLQEEDYDNLSLRKLKAIGKEQKLRGYARMKRPEILAALKKER
ncbi:Rho termination factor (modular protein) [Oscillatoriales cyanobacterium USR001]|nr:Rho termination factor (modular protein) [Oscillatoriales cyanobacterium USR001]